MKEGGEKLGFKIRMSELKRVLKKTNNPKIKRTMKISDIAREIGLQPGTLYGAGSPNNPNGISENRAIEILSITGFSKESLNDFFYRT